MMYTVSGTKSAIEKRNQIINTGNTIQKTEGTFIGPYKTFIPDNIINEYNNAVIITNRLYKNKKYNIDIIIKMNKYIDIMAKITNKRMIADNANILLGEYKNKINI